MHNNSRKSQTSWLAASLCAIVFAVLLASVPEPIRAADDLKLNVSSSTIDVLIGDDLFTRVWLVAASPEDEESDANAGHVPYLYPILGPGGQAMTRHWPMESAHGEEQDHRHHRSLWFAHGAVNGHDFWTGRDGSRIEHRQIERLSASGSEAVLRTRNAWIAPDGKAIASDTRTLTFRATKDLRTIDVDVTLEADHGGVVLGDTKEGTMAIRMAPQLRLHGQVANGSILNSEGVRDKECWGKRASWVRYSGKIDGKRVALALLQHPQNLRHPTWWHARDYGLLAANPFGAHDFEGKPEGTGDFKLAAGESLRLRYRFVFAEGKLSPKRLRRELESLAADATP